MSKCCDLLNTQTDTAFNSLGAHVRILYSSGASYYCGVSSLKTGVDSVHLFCDAAAATVIRGYTAELVIHPVLDQEYGMEEVINKHQLHE